MAATPGFGPVRACWICGGPRLIAVHQAVFELSAYAEQDPDLAAYTGQTVALVRCAACGFTQPGALPTLDRFFARLYDQRWSADWMEREYSSAYKDLIFRTVLHALGRRLAPPRRALLDLGAHVGRLLQIARTMGWRAEGVELNPQTATFAARATGLTVHRADASALADAGRRFDAVTLVDVLEHIPDPIPVLRGARRVLDHDGWIAVKVPNGPVQLRKEEFRARMTTGYRATVADNLVHVNHFSPRTLALALSTAGYADVAVYPAAPEIIQHGDAPSSRRLLNNAVRRVVYGAARLMPGGVQTPLALHLVAYGRAP
jgi:2-polyprenyl-3-methyl-5-hydroxy-6-metoxy-1,4-benzoquinol methylase